MLIPELTVKEILAFYNINVNGVFHIGAHECEEILFYNSLGISNDNIIWIEAIQYKVDEMNARKIPNVYQAVITDKDDDTVRFYLSNNIQSSSILELGSHLQEHPGIKYIANCLVNTITTDTFFKRNNLDASKYDFWNLDIQGAELLALKGSSESLQYPKVLYLEVNEKELYKNCGLVSEIDEFLKKHDFERVFTNMTRHGWGDAVYIKKTFISSINSLL